MATDMFYDLEIEVEVGQPSLSVSFDITKSDVDLTTEEIAILRGSGPDLEDYVKKEQTIAGITLENNISTEQLLEALNVQYGAEVNLVNDFRIDDISCIVDKIAYIKTINENYNPLTNKIATESDLPKTASDVHALPDSTKYGASIEALGTELSLKDQDGNVLSSTTIQDTTYGIATYDTPGLIKLSSNALAMQSVEQVSSIAGRQYAVQLNADSRASVNVPWTDTGAIGVEESGEGNAYTSSTYDVSTRKIIFTKGKTFLTPLDVDSALNSLSENPVQNKVLAVLIPSDASALNPLATQNFVNSSIATNTANFIGTFSNVYDLNNYSGTVTNNDYAFVVNSVITDNGNDWATFAALDTYDKSLLTEFDYAWVVNGSKFDLYRFDILTQEWVLRVSNTDKASVTLNTAYNRYKATVSGSTVVWAYEYTLNNSSFTASQWATINSGMTSEDKTKLDGIEAGAQVNTVDSVNGKTGEVVLNYSDVGAEASFSKNTAFNKNFETNTSNIKMNGNASVGTSSNVARADHIHPKDTSKQDTLVSGTNIKTIGGESILGSGNINMSNGLYISEDVQWDEDTEDASFSADEFWNGHCPTRDGDLVYVTGNGALFQCVNITYDEDDELYYTELNFLDYYYFWDFVRFSDYARSNRAGVVKVSTAYGFNMLTNGSIILQQATEYQIQQKASTYAPITANNYNYAVSQSTDVVSIKSKIPSTASDTNQLATVADIPTVNNPTITITQGGVTKGSFTLNQSSGDTIALDAGESVTEETYTIATTDWVALANSAPYKYSTTVTATYTIGNDTEVGIINDQPILFANYGFVVGEVSGQSVTIYSIGQPDASVTLLVGYRG